MKVLFLDMDGVVNSLPFVTDAARKAAASAAGHAHVDPAAVARLNRILDRTGAVVVVSSTWRHNMPFARQRLRAAGLVGEIIGRTPDLSRPAKGRPILLAVERRVEIQQWLVAHPDVTAFVILDDDDDAEIGGHFVKTTFETGLTDEHVVAAVRILGERA